MAPRDTSDVWHWHHILRKRLCVQPSCSCQTLDQPKPAGSPVRHHGHVSMVACAPAGCALLLLRGQACLPCTFLLPNNMPKVNLVGLVMGPTLAYAGVCPCSGVPVPADEQGRPQALLECRHGCRWVPAVPVSWRGSPCAQSLGCKLVGLGSFRTLRLLQKLRHPCTGLPSPWLVQEVALDQIVHSIIPLILGGALQRRHAQPGPLLCLHLYQGAAIGTGSQCHHLPLDPASCSHLAICSGLHGIGVNCDSVDLTLVTQQAACDVLSTAACGGGINAEMHHGNAIRF